jgi:pimeloyl-ACP methyl ester carboxylesterase
MEEQAQTSRARARSFGHRAARLAVISAAICVLFVLMLSLWNLLAAKWQHHRNPVPGNFYTVEGLQMHIDCSGTGSPAVVLEASASAPWSMWRRVQPGLSRVTRVCAYDRAGHGWSEPRKGSRDAETMVRELHSLLDQAGVKRPFVLAGHSAGGLYVREYAREFPAEVAGVALIDSSSPRQIDELPGFRSGYEEDKRSANRELWEDRVRVWSGWERLLGRCSVPAKDFQGWVGQYNSMACRPGYVDTDESELMYFEESSKEAERLRSFCKIPLLVISRDPESPKEGISPGELAQIPVWDREQEESKSLSPLSWRVIARNSGHTVPKDRPDVIIAEITRLIDYLRGGSEPPFGSTATK